MSNDKHDCPSCGFPLVRTDRKWRCTRCGWDSLAPKEVDDIHLTPATGLGTDSFLQLLGLALRGMATDIVRRFVTAVDDPDTRYPVEYDYVYPSHHVAALVRDALRNALMSGPKHPGLKVSVVTDDHGGLRFLVEKATTT